MKATEETMEEESLEQNVAARKAANELVDMGVTLAAETGLEVNATRRFWQYVMELAGNLIGDAVVEADVEKPASTTTMRRGVGRLTDDNLWGWGKHETDKCGEVPDDYLKWFLRQDWCDDWPDHVEYANLAVGE